MKAARRTGSGIGGFTLLEVLAVVLFTSMVITAAVSFYIDLNTASQRATERTRASRRAVGVLDRVARDLETAVLVRKPEGTDALEHPWLFYAESGGEEGADRFKFVHFGRKPRSSDRHESDLEMVAYLVQPGENDDLELWRWSSPRLPESLDRRFPDLEEDGALLLARDVASFGVRFRDEEGEWIDEWDSTTLVRSGDLPVAAEVRVAMWSKDQEEPGPALVRQVRLPLRPLDFAELHEEGDPNDPDNRNSDDSDDPDAIDADGDGEPDDPDGSVDPTDDITLADCVNAKPELVAELERAGFDISTFDLSQSAFGFPLPFPPSECRR